MEGKIPSSEADISWQTANKGPQQSNYEENNTEYNK
jgi:hypothetical protein